VSGKVSDKKGEALPGVSVIIKGTSTGTITDINGEYSIQAASGNTLVFSFIGLVAQEVRVANQSNINITMEEAPFGVDEVVVVGFGTQKKVNLTGAVESVGSEVLESRPVQNAVQMLQGVVAGLNVSTQGIGGTMNAGRSINVRGTGTIAKDSQGNNISSGSPLILIDGMDGSLDAINPNDIESISVLKDAASAAVYGSRAPFGVILVTTKKGKTGKTQVNYNNNFSWSSPVLLPDMMTSYEFVNGTMLITMAVAVARNGNLSLFSALKITWTVSSTRPMSQSHAPMASGTTTTPMPMSIGWSNITKDRPLRRNIT
jgi:TonB-dependent SusC/RagA subfamily outer membrane receptor